MPIRIPPIDSRTYEDLLGEALARIPAHAPEWTNFNKSDPGVTLIEVFAFLTDSLLYRAKQIPERNRLKFLSLLGIHLAPGASAQGLVQLVSSRLEAAAPYLAPGVELLAGKVPFRTTQGLYALPLEGQAFYKRRLAVDEETRAYYEEQYHQILQETPSAQLSYYETTPLAPPDSAGTALSDAVDGRLWIALLALPRVKDLGAVRRAIAGKVLSLGVVPVVDDEGLPLGPSARAEAVSSSWCVEIARPPSTGQTGGVAYDTLTEVPAPIAPVVIEARLPEEARLDWAPPANLPPGVDNLPPSLADREQEERLIAWLRISSPAGQLGRLLWVGINSVPVSQRAAVRGERLPDGTGEPDQSLSFAHKPVLAGSVRVTVDGKEWEQIDDLLVAGPEVVVLDPRLPPGATPRRMRPSKVYKLDPEAGTVTFGDGLHGERPARGATIRADYDHGLGAAGNVAESSIRSGPTLPPGIQVSQPVRTWGGVDAETARDGELHIARYLHHRDRLVTAADFDAVVRRTPGITIGRVEVLPAYHPERSVADGNQDAPGVVTVVVIPASDPRRPDTPEPDSTFLRAVADFIEPRRLVTTEVQLRGPTYKGLWISIGLKTVAGVAAADVIAAVEKAIRAHLSPLPDPFAVGSEDARWSLSAPLHASRRRGWPLWTSVRAQELAAVASRVDGVAWVEDVLLGSDTQGDTESEIRMTRLELPRIVGVSVASGAPRPIADLRAAEPPPPPGGARIVPVPSIPKDCCHGRERHPLSPAPRKGRLVVSVGDDLRGRGRRAGRGLGRGPGRPLARAARLPAKGSVQHRAGNRGAPWLGGGSLRQRVPDIGRPLGHRRQVVRLRRDHSILAVT